MVRNTGRPRRLVPVVGLLFSTRLGRRVENPLAGKLQYANPIRTTRIDPFLVI
jgi:hypothetical protein